MRAYVDASVLIGLGTLGELERVTTFDAEPVVLPAVREEVTTEPARTALDRALESTPLSEGSDPDEQLREESAVILDDPIDAADVHLVAAVLGELQADKRVAVVSDDRRLRTVANGLGATVTGTVGVVVRCVAEGLDPSAAKTLVRQLDRHGLHMTASLRNRAMELIEDAAE